MVHDLGKLTPCHHCHNQMSWYIPLIISACCFGIGGTEMQAAQPTKWGEW